MLLDRLIHGRALRKAPDGLRTPRFPWRAVISLLALGISARGAQEPEDSLARPQPLVFKVVLDNEAITPGSARFLHRAFEEAEAAGAQCLVLVMDTPGGLVESTRDIVKDILSSTVCVVVYVAPSGARAASAGVFITLAAHIAAMAPGTTIGAAHPVQIGALPISPPEPPQSPAPFPGTAQDRPTTETARPAATIMEEKIVNDTVAWVRALSQLRGRNADWAERAVKESVAVTASEALEENVIDLIAEDLDQLLESIDGREVRLPGGTVRLETKGAEIREVEMWWGERVLATISNPNVAFLLMMFGFYGILFELYTPGWGVAGILGIVCLVLGFFGMSVLPINYLGLVLIFIALTLFVAEAFVISFGALTVGGVICLILGGLMLVDSPAGFLRISMSVVLPVAFATALIALVLVGGVVRSYRTKALTGGEAMVGEAGIADGSFTQEAGRFRGTVRVHGELWWAVSPRPIAEGDELEIESRDGLTLTVRSRDLG